MNIKEKKMWLVVLLFILLLLLLFVTGGTEPFVPFYSSPPKRWGGGYDLRCDPYIPKKTFAWQNSSYEYVRREKCLK